MKWSHPELGPVQPIRRDEQAAKVWKHFHNPAERWCDLTDADWKRLLRDTTSAGCPPFERSERVPFLSPGVTRLLQGQHDDAYGPAYARELALPTTAWRVKSSDPQRWVARTPRAVIAFVGTKFGACVATAYRPLPPNVNVRWGDRDFQRQADHVFWKETGMDSGARMRLAEDLERLAREGAASETDAWWLALAIARGRAEVPRAPDLRQALAEAEAALATNPDVGAQLSASLHAEVLLDRLAEGLKQTEPEDAEHALSDIEDSLLVLETVGARAEATELLERASEIVAWASPEFSAIGRQANVRLAVLAEGSLAAELWSVVEESILGASIRELEPVHRPRASLVDELLPQLTLIERVAALASRVLADARELPSTIARAFEVRSPMPIMGHQPQEMPWQVMYREGVAGDVRVFAVDPDSPEGHEITGHLGNPGVSVWELEQPGQRVDLVFVSGAEAVAGTPLVDLLQEAEGREQVVVGTIRLSRPT